MSGNIPGIGPQGDQNLPLEAAQESTKKQQELSDQEKAQALAQTASGISANLELVLSFLTNFISTQQNENEQKSQQTIDKQELIQKALDQAASAGVGQVRSDIIGNASPQSQYLDLVSQKISEVGATANQALKQLSSNQPLSQDQINGWIKQIDLKINHLSNLSLPDSSLLSKDQQASLATLQNSVKNYISKALESLSPFIATPQIMSAANTANTIETLKSALTKAANTAQPVKLAAENAANTLGVAPKSNQTTSTGDSLWKDIANLILGKAFNNISFNLQRYNSEIGMQNAALSILNKMIQNWGNGFNKVGTGGWNFSGIKISPGNKSFLKELSNLHNAMEQSQQVKVQYKETLPQGQYTNIKKIVPAINVSGIPYNKTITVEVNYKILTKMVTEPGKFYQMCNSIKNEISQLRKDANKTIQTPSGGKKTIHLSNLTKMANSLSSKLNKFESAAKALNNVRTPGGGVNVSAAALEHIVSNFTYQAQKFAGTLKGDVQNLQTVSANAGNQLQVELSIYQQFLQTAPSLIQILASLVNSVAQNLKGQ